MSYVVKLIWALAHNQKCLMLYEPTTGLFAEPITFFDKINRVINLTVLALADSH